MIGKHGDDSGLIVWNIVLCSPTPTSDQNPWHMMFDGTGICDLRIFKAAYHNRSRLRSGRQRTCGDPRPLHEEVSSRISQILFAILKLPYHHLVVLFAWVMTQNYSETRIHRPALLNPSAQNTHITQHGAASMCTPVKPQPQKMHQEENEPWGQSKPELPPINFSEVLELILLWKLGSSSLNHGAFSDHPTAPAMWRTIATLCCFSAVAEYAPEKLDEAWVQCERTQLYSTRSS